MLKAGISLAGFRHIKTKKTRRTIEAKITLGFITKRPLQYSHNLYSFVKEITLYQA